MASMLAAENKEICISDSHWSLACPADAFSCFPLVQELRQQNALLSETKTMLEEEVASLNTKLETLGEQEVFT